MNQHDERQEQEERREALPEHEYREETSGSAEELAGDRPPDMAPAEGEPAIDPDQETPVAYKPRSG